MGNRGGGPNRCCAAKRSDELRQEAKGQSSVEISGSLRIELKFSVGLILVYGVNRLLW